MPRPIVVYLDSSDFAELLKDTEHTNSIKRELLKLRDEGIAKFGYSYWHVMELIQDGSDAQRSDRKRRASILKELCGENCFPYITDINAGFRFPNDGYWMPRTVITALSAKSIIDTFRTEIMSEKNIPRSLRR